MQMKSLLLISTIFCVTNMSCNNPPNKSVIANKDSTITPPPVPPEYKLTISWLDSSKVQLSIDTSLSYKAKVINCDSAFAIDYIGFEGEHTFLPINNKGQWINSIRKIEKLSPQQQQYLTSVIGDKNIYSDPLMVACYQPRLGIIYFKNGKVIAQTAICLGCARLESTIEIGDPKQEGLINERGRKSLNKLCNELQFSDCHN